MTNFIDCLTTATVRGLLDQGKADEARQMFDELARELREQGMSEQNANIKAAQKVTDRVGYQVEQRKKKLVLAILCAIEYLPICEPIKLPMAKNLMPMPPLL